MEALEGELAQQLAREADARRQRRSAVGAQDGSGGSGRPGRKKAGPSATREEEEEEDVGEEEDEEEKEEEEEEEGEPGAGPDHAIVARQAGLGGDAEGTRSSAGRHGAFSPVLILPCHVPACPWALWLQAEHRRALNALLSRLGWPAHSHLPPKYLCIEAPRGQNNTAHFIHSHGPCRPRFMTVAEVREVMRRMWAANAPVLARIYSPDAPDLAPARARGQAVLAPPRAAGFAEAYRMFFLSVLPVPPNRVRPPSRLGEVVYEHPFNTSLQKARPST